jgi:hypothetical protein
MISIVISEEFCRCYDRKHAEGKKHTQAVLARQRISIPWALTRDNRTCQATPPQHTSTQAA